MNGAAARNSPPCILIQVINVLHIGFSIGLGVFLLIVLFSHHETLFEADLVCANEWLVA
jgi:hypothetical protein